MALLILPTVAAFFRFLPSRMDCNSMDRVVMADMYRYRKGCEQAATRFNSLEVFDCECFS